MLFFGGIQRKKKWDLYRELRNMQKQMIADGMAKQEAHALAKEFGQTLESGRAQKERYQAARRHLRQARKETGGFLENMAQWQPEKIRQKLGVLTGDLEQVYHECLFREDDLDFRSTVDSLKRISDETETFRPMDALMLRSELENLSAILDEALGWRTPDFFALAYFFAHEDAALLKDMENGQRNQYLSAYLREHFTARFGSRQAENAVKQRAAELVKVYIYGM